MHKNDQFVNQNVNLVLIGQHSNQLQLSLTGLAKGTPCQYLIFLARPQNSCTLPAVQGFVRKGIDNM